VLEASGADLRLNSSGASTLQAAEANRLAAFVDPRKCVPLVANESRQLTHGNPENSCGSRDVVATRGDHIERFCEQRWEIGMLGIHREFLALPTSTPKFAWLVAVAARDRADFAREFEAKAEDRDVSILRLASALGCVRFNTCRIVLDPHRRVDAIAMLTTRTGHTARVDLTVREKVGIF
jgi:hypothetical protein